MIDVIDRRRVSEDGSLKRADGGAFASSEPSKATSEAKGFKSPAFEAASGAASKRSPGSTTNPVSGADAMTPPSFIDLVLSLASSAGVYLGIAEDPVTKERRVDLSLAKHTIDLLDILAEKTRGNLTPDEKRVLDEVLFSLKMQYVEAASASKTS